MNTKQLWLQAAKKAIEAQKTYRLYCMALGRMNKANNKKGKAIVMRALNYWRKEWLNACLLEQSLRGA